MNLVTHEEFDAQLILVYENNYVHDGINFWSLTDHVSILLYRKEQLGNSSEIHLLDFTEKQYLFMFWQKL